MIALQKKRLQNSQGPFKTTVDYRLSLNARLSCGEVICLNNLVEKFSPPSKGLSIQEVSLFLVDFKEPLSASTALEKLSGIGEPATIDEVIALHHAFMKGRIGVFAALASIDQENDLVPRVLSWDGRCRIAFSSINSVWAPGVQFAFKHP